MDNTSQREVLPRLTNQVYKRTAIIVFILSLLHLFIFNFNSIGTGVWTSLLTNAGFHGTYFFISRVPPAQVQRLKQRNAMLATVYKSMSKFTGIIAIFGAVTVTGIAIYNVVKTGEYQYLTLVYIMSGLFLGGLKLFKNLDPEL